VERKLKLKKMMAGWDSIWVGENGLLYSVGKAQMGRK